MPVHAPSAASVRGLPMQVRIALRDDFGKEDSALARAVAALTKELGQDVALRIDWNAAWSAAQLHFKDSPGELVPWIADAARDFVAAIQAAIETDEEWGLTLLREAERGNGRQDAGLGVVVEISPEAKAAETSWNSLEVCLVLRLPPAPAGAAVYYPAGSLQDAVRKLWDQDSSTAGKELPARAKEATLAAKNTGDANAIERMPKLSDIPRPAILGETTVPYWATIFWSRNRLEVHGTHPPTVELLIAYMEKHLTVNPNTTNKQTFAKLERIDNALGTGKTGVWLELRSNWGPEPNAMMPLQFFQGALGYRVERTTGSTWVLRRDIPFAP